MGALASATMRPAIQRHRLHRAVCPDVDAQRQLAHPGPLPLARHLRWQLLNDAVARPRARAGRTTAVPRRFCAIRLILSMTTSSHDGGRGPHRPASGYDGGPGQP
jgi:hypothetical protein